jgi:hypothetical protein
MERVFPDFRAKYFRARNKKTLTFSKENDGESGAYFLMLTRGEIEQSRTQITLANPRPGGVKRCAVVPPFRVEPASKGVARVADFLPIRGHVVKETDCCPGGVLE